MTQTHNALSLRPGATFLADGVLTTVDFVRFYRQNATDMARVYTPLRSVPFLVRVDFGD